MKISMAAAIALLAAAPAFAASGPLTIDFENVTSFASIAEYYNGGMDGAGNVGPSLGVSFGGDALGLVNDELGPYFSHAPSPVGVMTPVGAEATMNVASGFVGGVGFSYSSAAFVATGVEVWSGLDGSGRLLASFNLVANAQADGCSDTAFCRFDRLTSTFAGLAHSITFGNATYAAAFDDISITAVPEPTTALLLAMGLAGLLVGRRSRRD